MERQNAFRNTRAYQLFLTELLSQLSALQTIREEGSWNGDTQELLCEQFHKVRGSAGLFGLEAVGRAAYSLEQDLLAGEKAIEDYSEDFKIFEAAVRAVLQFEQVEK